MTFSSPIRQEFILIQWRRDTSRAADAAEVNRLTG
jgi:hypothetical protein